MSGLKELIRTEENGSLSFGNYELASKEKVSGFEHAGDIYKVKTYRDITRLEKNEIFAYESVPGTVVTGYAETEDGISFVVEGFRDTQMIVAVEDDADYEVSINGEMVENYDTKLSGKMVLALELEEGVSKQVSVKRK